MMGKPLDAQPMRGSADPAALRARADAPTVVPGKGGAAAIPPKATKHLRANPVLVEDSDRKYGTGAGASILGAR